MTQKTKKMKVLLEIPDNKAASIMDVLGSIKYIKTTTITPAKAQLIEEIKEAVQNVALAKKGKLKLKTARELYNEL